MIFDSIEQLVSFCEDRNKPLWGAVLEASCEEAGIDEATSRAMMRKRLDAMRSADGSYKEHDRSSSGLSGGDGAKMEKFYKSGGSIGGEFIGRILSGALRMGECNACMHRIVAAPTAGACGVIPAVLLAYAEKYSTDDDKLVNALYVTAGIGAVIAQRASISGAEAGCQAEIGSASAMAAAALVYLHGGTPRQMANAAAIALKNMMGLVCDPVAGLVEVPCVKRNAAGAMNALTAAELALAGIESKIPADEVIDTMRIVGDALPTSLKETGMGGIAASRTGKRLKKEIFGK